MCFACFCMCLVDFLWFPVCFQGLLSSRAVLLTVALLYLDGFHYCTWTDSITVVGEPKLLQITEGLYYNSIFYSFLHVFCHFVYDFSTCFCDLLLIFSNCFYDFWLILEVFGRRDPQNRIGLEKPVSGHHLNPPTHINEGIIGVFRNFQHAQNVYNKNRI